MEYPAAKHAREYAGDGYGDYIQKSLEDKVARGYYSEEYAQSVSLGTLFIGNDGD